MTRYLLLYVSSTLDFGEPRRKQVPLVLSNQGYLHNSQVGGDPVRTKHVNCCKVHN